MIYTLLNVGKLINYVTQNYASFNMRHINKMSTLKYSLIYYRFYLDKIL